MKPYEQYINRLIDNLEGGHVDDASDSGGETKYGITKRKARECGYHGPMAAMPRSMAEQIYCDEYWARPGFADVDEVFPDLGWFLFQFGVVAGVARASEYLQRCLNVLNVSGSLYPDLLVDADIGEKTIAALREYLRHRKSGVLLSAVSDLAGAHFIGLAERRQKDEKFIYGWLINRTIISDSIHT